MKKSKYSYNYPVNRELGERLYSGDLKLIAQKTNFSYDYVMRVLKMGTRTNQKIISTAKRLICLKGKL